jgi:hypothetical protein
MPVAAGTYINAFSITLPREQSVTRIAIPSNDASRRELEREHGTRLFFERGEAWTAEPIPGQPTEQLSSQEHPFLHLFNIRQAVGARAAELGWDFWIQHGEMNAVREHTPNHIGPFVVQRVLKTRAAWEGVERLELLLVASAGVRWLVELPLTDAAVRQVAIGEHVLRRSGGSSTLRRGRVDGFTASGVIFADREGNTQGEYPSEDYQLVARPDLVYRLLAARGEGSTSQAEIYRQLLVASGTLRPEDRRHNEYAVKDRFRATENLLAEFLGGDRALRIANGVSARVASDPKEIYPGPGPASHPWAAATVGEPRLRFDAAIPSRTDTSAYKGLRRFGAYGFGELKPRPRILLAYPSASYQQAEWFAERLESGSGTYPGFAGEDVRIVVELWRRSPDD